MQVSLLFDGDGQWYRGEVGVAGMIAPNSLQLK